MTETIENICIPELGTPRQGSVRDIYDRDDQLILCASDRISCYDRVLNEQIPHKGRILTEIAAFWFDQTKDIIQNHLISQPNPNVLVTKKCQAIEVEVIVRQFICGSMWRAYEKGEREFCGNTLPEGLTNMQKLPEILITPTTKNHEGHDENITAKELVEQGLCPQKIWDEICEKAVALFKRGQEVAEKRGMVLVDTKYEFGLNEKGELVLIDEIHTPDSSRYLFKSEADSEQLRFPDKEYVRGWLKEQGFLGDGPIPALSDEVVNEASKRYISVYEQLTGKTFEAGSPKVKQRILDDLRKSNVIKGCTALLICGSERDFPFVDKIRAALDEEGIPSTTIACSAHKYTRRCIEIIDHYNNSMEPVVCIAVAGRSNALSGVMAANLRWPVIACPPFKDHADYLTNIHSSLQMPSGTPAMTVLDPGNAASAAAKILKMRES